MLLQKKFILIILLVGIFIGSCAPKPSYKTREGKRKQKYYNMHQYDRPGRDQVLINGMKSKHKNKNKKVKKRKYKFY